MTDHRKLFNRWFSDILQDLEEKRPQDAGAVLLMVSFPLLESYLRKKCGIPEDCHSLNTEGKHGAKVTRFFEEIRRIFPGLGSRDEAQEFWKRFRHGLLHRATLNDGNDSWQVSDAGEAVEGDSKKGFRIHPGKLSKCVREKIASDLSTFLKGVSLGVDPYGGTRSRKMSPGVQHQDGLTFDLETED